MARTSYKERAKQRREGEILHTAARLIRERGYANLNMDDLAEEVGISKPTLYQHFSGKEEMVAMTFAQSMGRLESYMATLEGERSLDHLLKIIRYMLTSHDDPNGLDVSIILDASGALHHLKDPNSPSAEAQSRMVEYLHQLVSRAKAEGDIRAELPNTVVIGAMFSSMAILESPAILRELDQPAQLIDAILEFFRRGVAP
jgi:AcrR family transcriptional regulator